MVDYRRSQLFETFCRSLLDKIEHSNGVNKKKDVFDDYLQDWRRNCGIDYYDALRLLMPNYGRRMYNLKEATLGNVLLKALSISPNSPDGLYLKNYKRPQNNRPSGIFHTAALEVISIRSAVRSSSQTVHDLNGILDELATRNYQADTPEETVGKKQVKIFKKIIELYTPHQIQWIIRIILKDLRLGISDQSILSVLHPNAKELFDAGRSLLEICQSVANPHSESSSFSGIKLFSPCIPQSGFKCMSSNLESNFNKLSKPFYSEQKLDGERMLMHYDPDLDQFKWFTRRKNDNTRRYGSSSKDMNKLSGHIYQGLPKRSIILDGEMVAYDPVLEGFLPFGTLKSTSIDNEGKAVETVQANVDINDPTKPHPCYVIFDVLYYNGKSLINNPLKERLGLLNITVKNQNMHLNLIPRKELYTIEDIYERLEEATLKQQEGLVIKDPNSKYVLNSRLPSWIKFKPEYMDSIAESCDLVVVGAKYGSGRYGGVYRQLLCAVRDDTIPLNEPPRFITFAMVHSGMKDTDVEMFNSLIKTPVPYYTDRIPPWVDHPPKSNEKPDTLIHFQDAIVVEVKGTEITPSIQFGVSYTIRFPRVVKFRQDKGWEDTMTLSELTTVRKQNGRGQKRANEDAVESAKKKQKRKIYAILQSQQGLYTKDIPVLTTLFEHMAFYVLNGNKEYGKHGVERLIYQHGGRFIQNNGPNVINIGGDEDGMPNRLKVWLNAPTQNVVRAQYIVDCVEVQDILPLEPKYMFITLDEKKQEFLKYMDEYGDYYTKYINEDGIKELLERMGKDNKPDKKRRRWAQQVTQKYFAQEIDGMLFLNVVAYFDYNTAFSFQPPKPLTVEWVNWKKIQEEMRLAQDKFEFETGQVPTSTFEQEVTHVIVNQGDLSRFNTLKQHFQRDRLPRFVTLEWIQACIDNHTLVNELDYQPRIPMKL